ncbi:GreA/GreB family elongation factor, partial [Parasutterella excrementihominis]
VIDIDKRPPTDQIFFGATIVYANEQGDESKIRIVGIDEADASVGDVSWISPIARVFLKHFEGDTVLLPTPKGVKKLEILEVTYVNDPPGKPHII